MSQHCNGSTTILPIPFFEDVAPSVHLSLSPPRLALAISLPFLLAPKPIESQPDGQEPHVQIRMLGRQTRNQVHPRLEIRLQSRQSLQNSIQASGRSKGVMFVIWGRGPSEASGIVTGAVEAGSLGQRVGVKVVLLVSL